ncbi:DUF493 family protein [Paucihalobacter sp.]|uniref:DUF493 family protein n=1 Tax=Paucihalobacter sp. TaxID=2850405 RepID=UPI002FE2F8C6
MSQDNNTDQFYQKLKIQLQDTSLWPTQYLFKFIVKTNKEKIKDIQDIFDNVGAVIDTKPSKNGNYTSVSVHVTMKNPDAVINKYKIVAERVEGVISL